MKLWMKTAIAVAIYLVVFGLLWLMCAWMGSSVPKFMLSDGFGACLWALFCSGVSSIGIGLLSVGLFATVLIGASFFRGSKLEKGIGVGLACLYSSALVYSALEMQILFSAACECWWQGFWCTVVSLCWFGSSVSLILQCWLFAVLGPFIPLISPNIIKAIGDKFADKRRGMVSAKEFFGKE